MSNTIKAQAISATAGELKLSEVTVKMVVSTYDKSRAALKRVRSGSVVRLRHTGGGWYLLPDGSKVRGKAAAEDAMRALADG